MPIRTVLSVLLLMTAATAATSDSVYFGNGEKMVYTANQGFLSRIYVLNPDGSVDDYFEYVNYHFVDIETVDNEVYVSEAFAPRVYRVDIQTGDLDVVVDDWTLYYFYGIAFDGQYFYLQEWDLNRYDIDGDKDGTAVFDETVYGAAWDGSFYWTLTDDGIVKCWKIEAWPSVIELSAKNFSPPTPDCRGLWYDGEYFWTAESFESEPGYIYQFDYNGSVVTQIPEPTYSGWGVCIVQTENSDWTCGDADGSGAVDIDDAVYLISFIFSGGPTPDPPESGDPDCSDNIDIDDAVYVISYIFSGGPPPCAGC
jgi:hypothetical protein